PSILEEALDHLHAVGIVGGLVEVVEVERVERGGVGGRPLRGAGPLEEVALYLAELRRVLARELRAEIDGVVRVLEARARADDLQALRGDAEPRAQASDQQRHLRALRATIEVGLVDDEEEALLRVLLQPLAR